MTLSFSWSQLHPKWQWPLPKELVPCHAVQHWASSCLVSLWAKPNYLPFKRITRSETFDFGGKPILMACCSLRFRSGLLCSAGVDSLENWDDCTWAFKTCFPWQAEQINNRIPKSSLCPDPRSWIGFGGAMFGTCHFLQRFCLSLPAQSIPICSVIGSLFGCTKSQAEKN